MIGPLRPSQPRTSPDERSERDPQSERNEAETGLGQDGIAEVLDDGRTALGIDDQTEPIAIFQHEVRARQDVGIAAANLHDLHRAARRMRQVGKTHAHHGGLRDIHHHVIEVLAVGGRGTAGVEPVKFGDRFGISRDHQHIVFGQHEVRPRQQVRAMPAKGDELHALGYLRREGSDRHAGELMEGRRNLGRGQPLRLRHVDLRPYQRLEHEETEDRAEHPERIGAGIPDRGILIADRRDRGLEGRGARQRARENSQREVHPESHVARACDCGERTGDDGDEREDVGFDAGGARKAAEEIHAILNADAVHEEDEPENADESGRRRLGRDDADQKADEQYGADTEREAGNPDVADRIAQPDRQEYGDERLRVQQTTKPFHVCPPVVLRRLRSRDRWRRGDGRETSR